jgi:predicted glutamine amidotransferase
MCRLLFTHNSAATPALLTMFQGLAHHGSVPAITPPGHTDGWGIAEINEVITRTVSTQPANHDPLFNHAITQLKTTTVMAHLRKASTGAITKENCQPFVHGNLAFCHNGTIEESEKLPLKSAYADQLTGTTDSERFFQLIRQCIAEAGSTKIGLERAVSTVQQTCSYTALNCLLTDKTAVYGLREVSTTHPLVTQHDLCDCYYTLYYRQKNGLVISSEPLTKELWVEIPNHTLASFSIHI